MSKKILIVDDEQDLVDTLKYSLEHKEYDVLTANNGNEALDIYHSQKLDLIILDMMMPKMSGKEVLKTIRESELNKGIQLREGIPIIMLTGKTEDWMDSFTEGCNSFVIKPYDINELMTKIEEQLNRD